MKWLSLVLVALILVVGGAVAVRQLGSGGKGGGQLSAADEKKLESLKDGFRKERSRYLALRDKGGPEAELKAEEDKTAKIADQIMALGGAEAMQSIGRAPQMQGGGQGRMGRGGPGGGPPGAAAPGPGSRRGPAVPGGKPPARAGGRR
jgi:hypothetical protein